MFIFLFLYFFFFKKLKTPPFSDEPVKIKDAQIHYVNESGVLTIAGITLLKEITLEGRLS